MFTPGWSEMLIIGFIALLLFGKRLPEVARSFGQSFMEFKKGMANIESDVRSAAYSPPPANTNTETNTSNRVEEELRPTADKFEVPEPVSPNNED